MKRLQIKSDMQRGIEGWLKATFNVGKFHTVSEKQKYDPNIDEGIYKQRLGKAPEIVEVYLEVGEGWEYVCDIQELESQQQAYLNVMNGLRQLKDKLENRLHPN